MEDAKIFLQIFGICVFASFVVFVIAFVVFLLGRIHSKNVLKEFDEKKEEKERKLK